MPRPLITATGGRLFADPTPSPDETSFQVDDTSDRYYSSPYDKAHDNDLQPFPAPRTSPPRMDLADVLPATLLDPIASGSRITVDVDVAVAVAVAEHTLTSMYHPTDATDATDAPDPTDAPAWRAGARGQSAPASPALGDARGR